MYEATVGSLEELNTQVGTQHVQTTWGPLSKQKPVMQERYGGPQQTKRPETIGVTNVETWATIAQQ
jgi:hypothetical protein